MAGSSLNTDHAFGGPWTELKLDAVEYYLKFYTTALKAQPFDLWYIDAFAGSGYRTASETSGGLYEGQPIGTDIVQKAGSAKRALAVDPPFHRFIFIEKNRKRFAALSSLSEEYPDRDIEILSGDANTVLPELFQRHPWKSRSGWGSKGNRAVVFLDPYGMTLEWSTLKALAETKAVDLWYLFPIAATIQQLARNFSALDDHKARALDRTFGNPKWREQFYRTSDQISLVEAANGDLVRFADRAAIEAFFEEQLREEFSYVSPPLPLLTPHGAQLFSLYFCVANPSAKAITAAQRCVRALLKKYGPGASRHMFDH